MCPPRLTKLFIMPKTKRIALIGAGARGETFARQLYAQAVDAQLAAVCDLDEDRLAKFCDYCQLGDTPRVNDYHKALADPSIDAIVVTTPEFTHAQVTIDALRAGKHVYLEKPLAHTLEDCYRLADAAARAKPIVYVGFNLRAVPSYEKAKEVIDSGVLGRILQISGLEQLAQPHGAAFMRRWHRRAARSGGLLNTKCSHDMDILQWFIGHEHRVTKIASFGGTSVFRPENHPALKLNLAPATHCGKCPRQIIDHCAYRDRAGYRFPVTGAPIDKMQDVSVYGNDLCVYNNDKDIVDHQTVMLEWSNGVKGTFNLALCQHEGKRESRIWGENGFLQLDDQAVRFTNSSTGDTAEYKIAPRKGGHGGSDVRMLSRFLEAIESGRADSGVAHGLAATLLALKADEARLADKVVTLAPSDYR